MSSIFLRNYNDVIYKGKTLDFYSKHFGIDVYSIYMFVKLINQNDEK